ncbi:unnamed protein product [Amoebophrya sp. A120]|nr:unnamed protein product [Amoebophrya sp. A120]|eukprot:GSA120T00008597001.1
MSPLIGEDQADFAAKLGTMDARVKDFSTLSNASEITASFMELNRTVDFDNTKLFGSVTYTIPAKSVLKLDESTSGAMRQFVLDTNGGMKILGVSSALCTAQSCSVFRSSPYRLLQSEHKVFGKSLHCALPESSALDKQTVAEKPDLAVKLRIRYETGVDAMSTQWVKPEATTGKKYPYLFTQCQAIHARSLLPVQDCPSAKCAYTAVIHCPVWAQALMSAVFSKEQFSMGKTSSGERQEYKSFKFEQKIPVPSYLIALVCGDIVKKQISHRCDVWAEREDIEKVAWEFAETEEFLQIAEQITGLEYQWGRYDVLSLPPSFPYGGMENPCLTFVTPTLLAGDRSLADVVAHEISHSWTGNVVTNCTWEHFWLNEGWTVWLERKIKQEFVYQQAKKQQPPISDDEAKKLAKEAHSVASQNGVAHLKASVAHFESIKQPQYTKLVPDLSAEIDPDDVFSAVPYEKGCNLLHTIEQIVGEEKFLKEIVKPYIQTFKFKTITAREFREFVCAQCPQVANNPKTLDWGKWYFQPGMPDLPYPFESVSIQDAETLASDWHELTLSAGEDDHGAQELKKQTVSFWSVWRTEQRLVFFEKLNQLASAATNGNPYSELSKLDLLESSLTGLDTTQNCELLFQWYQLNLKTPHWKRLYDKVAKMLTSQGRMKYTRPLYRSLAKCSVEVANELFETHKNFYHPICQAVVAKDLANAAGSR